MDPLAIAGLIPGPIGSIASGITGLLSGSKQRKQQDAVMAIQRAIAEQQARIYQQYAPATTADLARIAGATIGPDTAGTTASGGWLKPVAMPGKVTFDPNYNPNAATAEQFFNPENLTSQMVAYREAGDRNYDQAVQAAKADAMNHGFIGRDSLLGSNIASIRTEQGRDNAAFQRGLLTDLVNRKNAYLMEGLQRKDAARSDLLNLTSGSAQGAYGTLGGLGGIYGSRASGAAQGVGNLASVFGSGTGDLGGSISDAVDWIKRQTGMGRRTSPGTTNDTDWMRYLPA